MVLCGVKYPFFEVWRLWQGQTAELELTAIGHGRLRLKLSQLDKFLQLVGAKRFSKAALHNLAEIARISPALAELRFRSKGERSERETFEHLSEFLPLGLDFEGILTFAKLVGA